MSGEVKLVVYDRDSNGVSRLNKNVNALIPYLGEGFSVKKIERAKPFMKHPNIETMCEDGEDFGDVFVLTSSANDFDHALTYLEMHCEEKQIPYSSIFVLTPNGGESYKERGFAVFPATAGNSHLNENEARDLAYAIKNKR